MWQRGGLRLQPRAETRVKGAGARGNDRSRPGGGPLRTVSKAPEKAHQAGRVRAHTPHTHTHARTHPSTPCGPQTALSSEVRREGLKFSTFTCVLLFQEGVCVRVWQGSQRGRRGKSGEGGGNRRAPWKSAPERRRRRSSWAGADSPGPERRGEVPRSVCASRRRPACPGPRRRYQPRPCCRRRRGLRARLGARLARTLLAAGDSGSG